MSRRVPVALYAVAIVALVLLQGCEDDPILEPSPGGDPGGGSYGILSFPQPSSGGTDTVVNPKVF